MPGRSLSGERRASSSTASSRLTTWAVGGYRSWRRTAGAPMTSSTTRAEGVPTNEAVAQLEVGTAHLAARGSGQRDYLHVEARAPHGRDVGELPWS